MNETLEIQGRSWQAQQIKEIGQWITENPTWSRYRLSRELCTRLELIRRNLEHTVAVYKRCLFGSRSEKIDPQELEARIAKAAAEARAQLAKEKRPGDPPPEAEEEQPEPKAPADKPAGSQKGKKRKARPHGRGGFPAHLPRRRIEHPVAAAKAVCACCAGNPPLIQVSQTLVQSDETPVRMQLADGQMETARLWAYGLPWAEVVFDFRTDKSHKGPLEFLTGTTARFVQADGGSSYSPVFEKLDLLHIACMAHIRRKIFEAREDAPMVVDLVLAAIQKLYRIEAQAKTETMNLKARLELRQREAKPIFMEVGQLIATMRKDVLPKGPLGRALAYAENQWPAMARYLEVDQAELDNNSIEHSLRGVVLGRRNWLHVGQEAGGEKAANLFSLMITCKRLKVEPYAYLHDVLRRLPSHPNKDIWQLTPRGWKETFAPKSPVAAPSG